MNKKKFYITLSVFIVLLTLWYLFVYLPQLEKLQMVKSNFYEITQKVSQARQAKVNLDDIQQRFKEEQQSLEEEKARFIKRDEMSKVTEALRRMSNKYGLVLRDFSPELNVFLQKSENRIIPLPIRLTLEGQFIATGKFLESWEELPFYLVPQGISINRLDPRKNNLVIYIDCRLYTWNE